MEDPVVAVRALAFRLISPRQARPKRELVVRPPSSLPLLPCCLAVG